MASQSRKSGPKPGPNVAVCDKKGRDQSLKKYKQAHCIGSRKLREKYVSYNDTYPMYESVLKVFLESKEKALQPKQDKKAKKRKHEDVKEPNNNEVEPVESAKVNKVKSEKKAKVEKKEKNGNSITDKTEKVKVKTVTFAKKLCKEVSKCNGGKKNKKSLPQFSVYQFMRLKREASLNASARVNIMFEKLPPSPPKKPKQSKEDNVDSKDKTDTKVKSAPKDKASPKEKSPKTKIPKEKNDKVKSCKDKSSGENDKSAKEKACDKQTNKDKSLNKDKSTPDKSCKERVEDVKKQRDEIIKKRKVKIEEKKKKAKFDKKEKGKKLNSKGKTVKQIKKLLPKCKVKDKDNKKNVKKKSDKKAELKKKLKNKPGMMGKTGKRIASLNAKALMAASKEVRPNLERAARIDRFCVSWKRVSVTTRHHPASARWVEGLGSTVCCTTQASVCISKKEQQICEESKTTTTTTTVMSAVQKPSPGPDFEGMTDDRPSSVVDVVGAHTPVKPLSRTPHCLNPIFSPSHNCVPPCNGYSCGTGSDRYVSSGQYQSLTLGGIGSLSSIQMMSYNQSPYRSAFSVPFNHAAIPPYGYYGGGYYPPNPPPPPPVLHQTLHEPPPCLLPHHLPVPVPHAQVKVLIHNPDSTHDCAAFTNYTKQEKDVEEQPTTNVVGKKPKVDSKAKPESKPKKKVERRRSKSPKDDPVDKKGSGKVVPALPRQITSPPHNWSWSGESEMKVVPTLVEGPPVKRKCYSAIQHSDGDMIHVRDCVLLRSGPRKKDIPFVAKVAALWEHPDDGEMMMSLLWYYRPEHTEIGHKPHHVDCEVFASKHRDENSVACIDDKGYVLTFNEYCRYRAEVSRTEQHSCLRSKVVPDLEGESPIKHRMPGVDIDPSTVFICRQVYDFRQKRMLKNPT